MGRMDDPDYYDDDLYDDEDDDTEQNKFLTFRIADQDYGIDICHVTEIVGVQDITTLPEMPSFIKGVINLRGRVIPVMDIRMRFGMEEREYDERTCIIVVNVRDTDLGIVVDTVNEVVDIPEENLSAPPRVASGPGGRYLQGLGKIGDSVKVLLDVGKLLFEEELQQLNQIA